MINTVIYDMDGLLLDTEPLWGKSMLRIAEKHRIPITHERFKETTGLRIYEVTDYWSVRYPWQGSTPTEVADEILDDIIEAAKAHGRVMPGVLSSLELFQNLGFKIGLASSSPERMITELVGHFGLTGYFDNISSADAVELGKPHPAVFLHCARLLGAMPLQCVVLEDSVNGVIAGKAARMKVIAVPEAPHAHDPRFVLADARIGSLEEIDAALLERL
jgi:HAD superfamily hydrolase (TIGR01509 family)